MTISDARVYLIREVQKLGMECDHAAKSESVCAVESGDPKDMEVARRYVAIAKTRGKMASDIVELINRTFMQPFTD